MSELITPQGSRTVSAILFDKDGTLLQFVSLWGAWGECFLDHFTSGMLQKGFLIPKEQLPALMGTIHNAHGSITDYDRNGPLAMGTMEDLYAILAWQGYLQGLSWVESMEWVHQCRLAADAMLEETRPVLPLPGLQRFLDDCAAEGLPLAVVTADETAAAELHLRWLGIRHYFSAVIGTDQVKQGKPFADMALLACSRLGVEPGAVAVIGDTNGDMRMAKAAGAAVAVGIASADIGDSSNTSSTSSGTTAANILPDADCIVQSYAELRFGDHTPCLAEHHSVSFEGDS